MHHLPGNVKERKIAGGSLWVGRWDVFAGALKLTCHGRAALSLDSENEEFKTENRSVVRDSNSNGFFIFIFVNTTLFSKPIQFVQKTKPKVLSVKSISDVHSI